MTFQKIKRQNMSPSPANENKGERGFTLVEVLVVMVIITLLTTFVVLNLLPSQDKAMVQKAKGDIHLLEQASEFYRLDMGVYPRQLSDLKSLETGAPNAQNYRKGGYVKKLPNDPWGNPYTLKSPGDHGDIDIYSYGADGQEGGEEMAADLVNWE